MPSTSIRTGALPLHTVSLVFACTVRLPAPAYLICSARVPSTRAFSYLVMYGVVVRRCGATFLSFSLSTVFLALFLAAAAALASPETTMLSSLWSTLSGSCALSSPS